MTYVWRCINSVSRILVSYVTTWNEFNQCITDVAVTKCSIHLQRHFKPPTQWPSVFWLRLHKIPRHYINTVLMTDCGFTSHSTQNRSFWRRSPSQSIGLVWKHKTWNNKSTHSPIKRIQKKARFSRLLRHLTWKWRGPILVLALRKFVTYLLT